MGVVIILNGVNESLDEKVRSMVVGLMVNTETMAAKIKRLENDLEAQKHKLKKLTVKNERLKLKLHARHRRQILYLYVVILLMVFIVIYISAQSHM